MRYNVSLRDVVGRKELGEWVPIAHGSIGHEPFTALEQ